MVPKAMMDQSLRFKSLTLPKTWLSLSPFVKSAQYFLSEFSAYCAELGP